MFGSVLNGASSAAWVVETQSEAQGRRPRYRALFEGGAGHLDFSRVQTRGFLPAGRQEAVQVMAFEISPNDA